MLQTRLWHDDIGREAGARIAFAIGVVTDDHLARLSVSEWDLLIGQVGDKLYLRG